MLRLAVRESFAIFCFDEIMRHGLIREFVQQWSHNVEASFSDQQKCSRSGIARRWKARGIFDIIVEFGLYDSS